MNYIDPTFTPIEVGPNPTPEQRGGALGTKHGKDLKVGDLATPTTSAAGA